MSFDLKTFVGTVAPGIATALGGPLAGLAVQALGQAVGVDSPSPETLTARLQGATSADLVAIKQAELQFQHDMAELDVDLNKISADDRASARAREEVVRDMTPRNLAYLYTLGFFATLMVEFVFAYYQVKIDPALKTTMDTTLGVMFGMMLGSKEYYFGTSSGSDKKTDIIAGMKK